MKTITQVSRSIGQVLAKNSPTILTGLGVTGLVTTTVLAVKATPKAIEAIQEAELFLDIREPGDEVPRFLTKKDILKLTYKYYLPAAGMGLVTIACIIGANSINVRRQAALAGLYSISETALKEYQSKVIETIGKNKETKIKDEIAKDRIAANPASGNTIYMTGNGEHLMYDTISGRYFKSNVETIRQAMNDINYGLCNSGDMWCSLNQWYSKIGLSSVTIGKDLGWDTDHRMEIVFSTHLTDTQEPCIVLEYEVEPRYDYQ